MPFDDESTQMLLRHVAEIGAGRCSITDAEIEAEPNPTMREVLAALLMLHEDLTYATEVRARAEQLRAEAAREQERLNVELRRAVLARDDFLSVASHELRTPISTLGLQVEMLDRMLLATSSGPRVVQALLMVRRQVERLERLVAELLNVTRIMGGQLTFSFAPVHLPSLVADIVERFEHDLRKSGSSLHLDLGDAESMEPDGEWDPFWLDQVVTNLLANAIRYGRGKPIDLILTRCTADRGDTSRAHARIAIRDHGVGIAPEDLGRIFERFERSVSSAHYGGLGLGLWISRSAVESMGGRLIVESQVGIGSTFTIELSCDRAAREKKP